MTDPNLSIRAVIYDVLTGKILRHLSGPRFMMPLQVGEGEGWAEGEGADTTHYVSPGPTRAIAPRPPCPAVLTGANLTDIPLPATLFIDGTAHELPAGGDDFVELEFDYPATYQLRLECWPFLDTEFTFTQP
jgi:hypothetical protein